MDRNLDFTVNPSNFSNLPEYVKDIKKDGLRFVVILDPVINVEVWM